MYVLEKTARMSSFIAESTTLDPEACAISARLLAGKQGGKAYPTRPPFGTVWCLPSQGGIANFSHIEEDANWFQ